LKRYIGLLTLKNHGEEPSKKQEDDDKGNKRNGIYDSFFLGHESCLMNPFCSERLSPRPIFCQY